MAEYRQKPPHRLTEAQKELKFKRDKEYELAVQTIATPFYTKKHESSVTKKEEADFRAAKVKLWDDYKAWAISKGLYEEIVPEEQLALAETRLQETLSKVNKARQELNRKPLKLIEGD